MRIPAIYIFNIFRIALLCWAIYYFPEYEHILHGVLFPLVIYGVVFALWIIWTNGDQFNDSKFFMTVEQY